jgi:hypothetical protein
MDDTEKLRELETRRDNIMSTVKNIERDVTNAENALIRGEPPERLVSFIRDRNGDLRGHLQDLGRAEAQIAVARAQQRERSGEVQERKDADRWDARKADEPSDRAWYKRPAADGERAPEQATADRQREWYKRDRAGEQPRRENDRTDRTRER